MKVRFAAQRKRLRLRAIPQNRNLYPQGESNPCLQDENLIS